MKDALAVLAETDRMLLLAQQRVLGVVNAQTFAREDRAILADGRETAGSQATVHPPGVGR